MSLPKQYTFLGPGIFWLIIGGIVAIVGLLALAGGAWQVGGVMVILGLVPSAWRILCTKVWLTCTEQGLNYRTKSVTKGDEATEVAWGEVTGTRWYMTREMTQDDDGSTRYNYRRFFTIQTARGDITIEDRGRGFQDVVAACNVMTPQLSYIWERKALRGYVQAERPQSAS